MRKVQPPQNRSQSEAIKLEEALCGESISFPVSHRQENRNWIVTDNYRCGEVMIVDLENGEALFTSITEHVFVTDICFYRNES